METLEESYSWCRTLATEHYENFPVASILVPAPLRRHMVAVYAISRLGDDIGDEPWTESEDERLEALSFLDAAVDGLIDTTGHPIFMALHATMDACNLPPTLFHRLFEAFRQDSHFRAPQTWEDLTAYCHFSANPVGELVLRIAGNPTDEAINRSDAVCTALQITNMIQDQSRDAAIGRTYLPVSTAEALESTRQLYAYGASVVDHITSWRMRQEIRLIVLSGHRMLERCAARADHLLQERPALTKTDYLRILLRLLVGKRL